MNVPLKTNDMDMFFGADGDPAAAEFFSSCPEISHVMVLHMNRYWAKNFHTGREYHELIHVLSGRESMVLPDGRRYDAEEGDTLLTPAGVVHRDDFEEGSNFKVIFISFRWAPFEKFFSMTDNLSLRRMQSAQRGEVRRLFSCLRDDFVADGLDKAIASVRLLNILLLFKRCITPRLEESAELRRRRLVADAKSYIEHNYPLPLSLDVIAGALRVSACHLSRCFRSEAGMTLVEYLTEVRIAEARRLLRDGSCRVSEVSELVGFRSANYFGKVFRRRLGCSPSDFQ